MISLSFTISETSAEKTQRPSSGIIFRYVWQSMLTVNSTWTSQLSLRAGTSTCTLSMWLRLPHSIVTSDESNFLYGFSNFQDQRFSWQRSCLAFPDFSLRICKTSFPLHFNRYGQLRSPPVFERQYCYSYLGNYNLP